MLRIAVPVVVQFCLSFDLKTSDRQKMNTVDEMIKEESAVIIGKDNLFLTSLVFSIAVGFSNGYHLHNIIS